MERSLLKRLQAIDLDDCLKMSLFEFYQFLGPKQLGLFADEDSFKCFVIDYLYKAYHDDQAKRPIQYMKGDSET